MARAKTCKWTKVYDGWQTHTPKGHCTVYPGKGGYYELSCYLGAQLRGAKHYSLGAKTVAPLKRTACSKLK
jgi:hypothetical protein